MKEFSVIVLAAGKGKRMYSNIPKVLHKICGMPMIYYPIKTLISLKHYIKQIIVVVGYKSEDIKKNLDEFFPKENIEFAYQKELLGTADAVKVALEKIKFENVLILCADTPLLKKDTLLYFIKDYLEGNSVCSIITSKLSYPNQLGKIIRDDNQEIMGIEEQLDSKKRDIEVNSGIYIFNKEVLEDNLKKIQIKPKKKEYFLTDIISIIYREGFKIRSFSSTEPEEIFGINTRDDLIFAENIIRRRLINQFINNGVYFLDKDSVFIQEGVKIGKDTVIYPFTFIEKNVIIGKNCSIGPFIHIREGTRISSNTQVGNFLELVRCKIGKNVKAKHFGYLGDTVIKDNVNIGAGTVTANFDGKKKNKTIIDKEAFIGSDTILVAPVKIGKKSLTGAGSVVTKNVKPNTVVAGVPAKFLKKVS